MRSLGDSLETGESAWQALRGVLGLVVRRQILLWKSWRPWLAAFGFALPCSLLLIYVSISVTFTSARLMGLRINQWAPTGHEGLPMLLGHIFLLIAWAWTSGFAVGSLSPRTIGWNLAVSLSVFVHYRMNFHVGTVSPAYALLFVAPAAWGIRQGMRKSRLPFRPICLLFATMAAIMTAAWIRDELWIFNWLLLAPALFLVASARRSQTDRSRVQQAEIK